MIVRENYIIRPYRHEDLPALVDLINCVSERLGAVRRVTIAELTSDFESPTFDAANNSFLVERDGQIIAMSDLEFNAESGRSWSSGAVHPDDWHQGIGTELIRLTEARCMEWALAETAPEQSITIQRHTIASNAAAIQLFESHDYRPVRSFYSMLIDLDTPVEVPPLPAGIVLRPFDRERDTYAVYEAFQEAFADHWGFVRNTFEEWEHYFVKRPDNDFSLWMVAYDGDQIAGLCLCRALEEENPPLGWVDQLAVRRPWRKRGLGSALLRLAFATLQQRGYQQAGLGVDASSLTNAVALYERAGMRVATRSLAYRKTLRGTDDEA